VASEAGVLLVPEVTNILLPVLVFDLLTCALLSLPRTPVAAPPVCTLEEAPPRGRLSAQFGGRVLGAVVLPSGDAHFPILDGVPGAAVPSAASVPGEAAAERRCGGRHGGRGHNLAVHDSISGSEHSCVGTRRVRKHIGAEEHDICRNRYRFDAGAIKCAIADRHQLAAGLKLHGFEWCVSERHPEDLRDPFRNHDRCDGNIRKRIIANCHQLAPGLKLHDFEYGSYIEGGIVYRRDLLRNHHLLQVFAPLKRLVKKKTGRRSDREKAGMSREQSAQRDARSRGHSSTYRESSGLHRRPVELSIPPVRRRRSLK